MTLRFYLEYIYNKIIELLLRFADPELLWILIKNRAKWHGFAQVIDNDYARKNEKHLAYLQLKDGLFSFQIFGDLVVDWVAGSEFKTNGSNPNEFGKILKDLEEGMKCQPNPTANTASISNNKVIN
jgi:hypothetical protein